jgi:putative aldouronate transport system substrate-binding protein
VQGSPEDIFNQKASDLQQKYYPKLVLASEGQFESVWNDYLKEFGKLDAAGFEAFMTAKVKDRVAGKW